MTGEGKDMMQVAVADAWPDTSTVLGGKRVAGNAYFYITHPTVVTFIASLPPFAAKSLVIPPEVNVLRIGLNNQTKNFSLLAYRDFFTAPFPELIWSQRYSISKLPGPIRREPKNPAILHRKELLLPDEDSRRSDFQVLTDDLVAKKLLPADCFIGRRSHWEMYLRSHGYKMDGSKLRRIP